MAWYSGSKDSEVVAVCKKARPVATGGDCGLCQDVSKDNKEVVVDDLDG